jgi:hypothetical protein
MKNKKSILIGIFITLIFIFLISGILQYLIFNLLGVTVEELTITSSGLSSVYNVNIENNIYFNSFLLFSKLFISISFLELAIILIAKFPIGIYRFATISFILFLTGYLILSSFYGIISALLSLSSNSNFSKLINILQLEGNQSFALLFFMLIIFVFYLHFVQKRVIRYLK